MLHTRVKAHLARFLPATKETLARAMGYNRLHGTAQTSIRALLLYGLLQQVDPKVFTSSDRARLLLTMQEDASPQRRQVLELAAFTPPLFQQLRTQYGEKRPTVPEVMRDMVRLGTPVRVVATVAKAYLETLDFLAEEGADARDLQLEEGDQTGADGSTASSTPAREREVLSWPLTQACHVRVELTGSVTRQAIQKLIQMLESTMVCNPGGNPSEDQQSDQS